MNKHAAVKCTYNNGGESDFVGFVETCSEDVIKLNTNSHVWCSQEECACREYFEGGFQGERPVDPCLESTLFKDWWFGAGTFHSGPKKGEPKRANLVDGGIAILTTRFPGDPEKDRKIIGLYKIGYVTNDPDDETKFFADDQHRIRLPLDEVNQLFLWDYYTINDDQPAWGTGLLRYLSDEQTKSILLDLSDTVQSVNHKEIIQSLLQDFEGVDGTPVGLRKTTENRTKRIATGRKYGPGGEGDNHKSLKEWIGKNPLSVGLNNVKSSELEYVFCSGDTVDILFELESGQDAVVEVETTVPLPGAHQAIKYRALRCAERSLSLTSRDVMAILVAWVIPPDVKRFCDKYKINCFEIKLEE